MKTTFITLSTICLVVAGSKSDDLWALIISKGSTLSEDMQITQEAKPLNIINASLSNDFLYNQTLCFINLQNKFSIKNVSGLFNYKQYTY